MVASHAPNETNIVDRIRAKLNKPLCNHIGEYRPASIILSIEAFYELEQEPLFVANHGYGNIGQLFGIKVIVGMPRHDIAIGWKVERPFTPQEQAHWCYQNEHNPNFEGLEIHYPKSGEAIFNG